MDRHAADNKYFHQDFHISGDRGLAYAGEKWGDAGVKDYLERFTLSWYAPLINEIKSKGLTALQNHLKKIYAIEEAPDALHMVRTENELDVKIDYCPGVTYMRSAGHVPSIWYKELTSTVNKIIAEKSGIGFEMIFYEPETGRTNYKFFINEKTENE